MDEWLAKIQNPHAYMMGKYFGEQDALLGKPCRPNAGPMGAGYVKAYTIKERDLDSPKLMPRLDTLKER